MRKFLYSVAAMLLLVPVFGLAAEVRNAELVAKDTTVKNLYLGGQNPTVDGNVTGDLVVAGGNVTVNGDVSGGVLAVGGTVMLTGKTAQNVRIAAGSVIVSGEVDGDLVVLSGEVILETKSVVKGDVIVLGGNATLKGEVLGSVKNSYVGSVVLAGKVGGKVELGQVGSFKLESTAVVAGDIKYTAKNEGTISSDAKVGGKVEYTKLATTDMRDRRNENRFGSIFFGMLMAFVTLLVFIKLMPKFSKSVLAEASVDPWAKLGIGLLTMIVTPVAMLLLLVTLVGWGVMAYVGLAYVAVMAFTGTLTALLAGSFTWKYFRKEKDFTIDWKTAGIGVVLVAVAKMIPIVGWLAAFLLAALVFGTLTVKGFSYIKAQRA